MPLSVVALSGCGPVEFVHAPFVPSEIELAYSPVEDLTRIRFQVADARALALERFELGGYVPLDFAAAPFPSGAYSCSVPPPGACFQLAVRGWVAVPGDKPLLRARHDSFGTFAGTPPMQLEDVTQPLELAAEVESGNERLNLVVNDWLEAPPLSRRFKFALWEEPVAECGPRPDELDAAGDVRPGVNEVTVNPNAPEPGRFCARIRSQPRDGGAPSVLTAPFHFHPMARRGTVDFRPPSEVSAIVWRYVVDLQTTPDRCEAVKDAVHEVLEEAFTGAARGARVHELPRIDVSPDCDQKPLRTFDGAAAADETKRWIAANSKNQFDRPILVYVNNLDGPLPEPLLASLGLFRDSFADERLQVLSVLIGMQAAAAGFPWDQFIQYAAASDMQFVASVEAWVRGNLPLVSQLHELAEIVPLFDEATLMALKGARWKVCQASPPIIRMQGPDPIGEEDPTPVVDVGLPPGFRVMLPRKVLVPYQAFTQDHAIVRWEACTRFCDNPFRDEGGALVPSWRTSPRCAEARP